MTGKNYMKFHFIETQPRLSVYILSIVACAQHGRTEEL